MSLAKGCSTSNFQFQYNKSFLCFERIDLVHSNFIRQLKQKYPELTMPDMKLCALPKMDFSTKEIANLLNISVRGLETRRYRLRKKLDLNSEVHLPSFFDNLE